jgi:hypothetical protein
MKMTATQLRRIIAEEVENLNEAADLGSALAAGNLTGVSKGTIKAAVMALSDADFKKLHGIVMSADLERKERQTAAATAAGAKRLSPALAAKINDSLSSLDWSWTGVGPRASAGKQDVVRTAVAKALGLDVADEFMEALYYVAGDEDAFRKMSSAEADRQYNMSIKAIKKIAGMMG